MTVTVVIVRHIPAVTTVTNTTVAASEPILCIVLTLILIKCPLSGTSSFDPAGTSAKRVSLNTSESSDCQFLTWTYFPGVYHRLS